VICYGRCCCVRLRQIVFKCIGIIADTSYHQTWRLVHQACRFYPKAEYSCSELSLSLVTLYLITWLLDVILQQCTVTASCASRAARRSTFCRWHCSHVAPPPWLCRFKENVNDSLIATRYWKQVEGRGHLSTLSKWQGLACPQICDSVAQFNLNACEDPER
jgi:hypothetical protein